MKPMIKMELIRAFQNKKMVFSLMAGAFIIILQYIFSASVVIKGFYKVVGNSLDAEKITYLTSAYNCWIGTKSDNFQLWYFFIMPILAAIPYGASFFVDCRQGYVNNILIKTERKKYLGAKLITCFVSGGTVASFPLLLSYLLSIISLPALRPYPESSLFSVTDKSILNHLFYSDYTVLYVVIYIVFDFVLYGLINCLCIIFAYIEDNRYIILLSPFVLLYGIHVLFIYFFEGSSSPLDYAVFTSLSTDQLPYILIEIVILCLFITLPLLGGKKDVS